MRYEITSPEGKRFEVNAPEGATQEQVLAYAQGQFKAAAPPAQPEDPGVMGSLVIGAGRMGDRMKEGLIAAGYGGSAIIGKLLGDRLSRRLDDHVAQKLIDQQKMQEENTKAYKPLEEQHPVATAVGEALPLVAAPMLRVAEGAGALPAMVNMGTSSALAAATEYGTPEERAKRALLAGATAPLAAGAATVAGKVMRPITANVTESAQAAIDAAKRLGITLTPGQMTGNKALQLIEARLAKLPGSSGSMQEFAQANQRAMNSGAAGAMGETASEITPEVLRRASDRIGGDFQKLSAKTDVQIGQPFTDALAALQNQQASLGKFADGAVNDLVDKGIDLASKGQVDGRTYQLIRSRLGMKSDDAFRSGNSEMGQALKTVQNALDDAAQAGLSKEDRAAWDTARKQWAALKTVEKGNVVEAGNVSPGRLKEALRSARPKDYKEGRLDGPLADIATYAENFKPPPDSGTAQNLFVQGLMTGWNPIAGAASVAAPWATQKAMFSGPGSAYLTKGFDLSPGAQTSLQRLTQLLALSGGRHLAE